MYLVLDGVSKRYGHRRVVDEVSFTVAQGEMISIVGPSGAGKTTLLRLIAGLEPLDAGTIHSAADLKQQPAILVFQDYQLFPTMTVFDNVAFGLRCRSTSRHQLTDKVEAMLAYFGLSEKRGDYPNTLSAGQQQRLALARAMVVNPSLLLLDEPFANLDRNLKAETAEFIRSFQREYQVTTISVTHDLTEAFMMSDRIGIMLDGRLCQFDQVKRVYEQPATARVAAFLGHVNTIPARWYGQVGLGLLETGGADRVSVRAEAIDLLPDPQGEAVIQEVVFAGHYVIYHVALGQLELTSYRISHDLQVGDRVRPRVRQCIVFDEE